MGAIVKAGLGEYDHSLRHELPCTCVGRRFELYGFRKISQVEKWGAMQWMHGTAQS